MQPRPITPARAELDRLVAAVHAPGQTTAEHLQAMQAVVAFARARRAARDAGPCRLI